MAKTQDIEFSVLRTKVKINTDQPGRMFSLADEMSKELAILANKYPGAKQNELFIFGYLKLLEEKYELQEQFDSLNIERDKIIKAIDSVLE